MERVRSIESFWSWLPAFRVVAETEHLTAAAEQLGVSRSALSRTVRLVEDAFGTPLFDRVGRNMRLNRIGEEFLTALRDSMRLVHEGFVRARSEQLSGRVRLSCVGLFLHVLRPALDELVAAYPDFVPELTYVPAAAVGDELHAGTVDLAILSSPTPDPTLQLELLAVFEHGVYCGRDHPLFGRADASAETILEYPFIAPSVGRRNEDHWPPSLERTIGMRIHQLSFAFDVCADGQFLAVFPDSAVAVNPHAGDFFRLPFELLRPVEIYAMRRRDIAPDMAAQRIVEVIRRHLG